MELFKEDMYLFSQAAGLNGLDKMSVTCFGENNAETLYQLLFIPLI